MTLICRRITAKDNDAVARIIRTVMPEFGASGAGFAIHDKEVDGMFAAYNVERAAYFVCEENNIIVGGGGVGPLAGGDADICELKKMYFLPQARRRGLGQKILEHCLAAAREMSYNLCYLETFNTMKRAMKLYERNGFEQIPAALGSTGHFACDTFYLRKLG
jgi:putative acetyltransferase